jgi:hypothetical protein
MLARTGKEEQERAGCCDGYSEAVVSDGWDCLVEILQTFHPRVRWFSLD